MRTTDWLLEICRFSLVAQFAKYPKSREMWKAMMCKLFLVPSCLRARLRSGRRSGIDRDIRRGLGTRIIHKKHCILMQLFEEVNMAGYHQKKNWPRWNEIKDIFRGKYRVSHVF